MDGWPSMDLWVRNNSETITGPVLLFVCTDNTHILSVKLWALANYIVLFANFYI